MKKFWIIMGSLLLACVATTITTVSVLASSKVQVDFKFEVPASVYYYDKSTVKQTADLSENSRKKLIEDLNNALCSNKLNLFGNGKINTQTRIDPTQNFSDSTIFNNRCVVLEYENTLSVIAWNNNNSKKVNYNKLLIILNGKSSICDHEIYYSTSDNFNDEPLIVALNETSLNSLFK